jgi:RNA polymerase sigma-70 factor, ECF subfamily
METDVPMTNVALTAEAEADRGPGSHLSLAPQETPPQQQERLLVSRLRRRDAAAFETLVKMHQDRVYDFCSRMLNDRDEAFDVAQEVFVSIHQHLEHFRADAKLSTWIFRIARNQCLNRLKYLKRRGRGATDEFGEANELAISESLGGSGAPDEDLTRARERKLVHRAIAELEEEQRVLVVLRDVEGLSYEEMVEITELALGTVKSRLHRAREALVEILERLEKRSPNEGD